MRSGPSTELDAPPIDDERSRGEVVRTHALTKVYPPARGTREGLHAVDRLHLSVLEGEIYGLLGPNGAGKSTTIGMLTTRVVPTAGRATVNGIDVVADPGLAKQRIGVVPQFNTLDRSLNVWENLFFHGRYFGMNARAAGAAADEVLEKLRLTGRADAEVRTLSGGLAKRVMVARAILHRPAILFLDEPTAGLDPQSRLALWEILGQLHAEGQTILLTTHYMEEADRICDRVAIMDHGRILALDTPARLKQSVAGAAGRATLSSRLQRYLAESPDSADAEVDADVDGGGRVTATERALARVVAAARDLGVDLGDLDVEDVTLETVFITLTGRELRD